MRATMARWQKMAITPSEPDSPAAMFLGNPICYGMDEIHDMHGQLALHIQTCTNEVPGWCMDKWTAAPFPGFKEPASRISLAH